MTKKKNKGDFLSPNFPKCQEWIGEIITRDKKKVYQENEFHGNTFYRCKVTKDKSRTEKIFVYSNIVSKEIFRDIEQSKYPFKKYLFSCKRVKWGWILHDWQELGVNLNSSKSETLLRNHE